MASDVTHQDAGGQKGILKSQSIDLQWYIVDVNEVDAQGSSHADPAGGGGRVCVPAAGAGYEGDVALDGLHFQALKVPLAPPAGVCGGGSLH